MNSADRSEPANEPTVQPDESVQGASSTADKIANALALLDTSPVLDVARGRSLEKRAAAANETAARIVDKTLDLLAEVGLDFTVEDVLRAAKVSRKTFYRFFDGKDDLLFAAVRRRCSSVPGTSTPCSSTARWSPTSGSTP